MSRHIRSQNHTHAPFPESSELVPREIRNKIKLLLIDQMECFCNVKIFLNALIVVPNRALSNCIDVISIVQTIMSKVVTDTADQY